MKKKQKRQKPKKVEKHAKKDAGGNPHLNWWELIIQLGLLGFDIFDLVRIAIPLHSLRG